LKCPVVIFILYSVWLWRYSSTAQILLNSQLLNAHIHASITILLETTAISSIFKGFSCHGRNRESQKEKETKTIHVISPGNSRLFISYLFPLSQVVQLEDLFVRKCPYGQISPLEYLFHSPSVNIPTRFLPYEDSE
jgi:hypothetical protein